MDNERKPYRILVINPGSNTTKIAVFENQDNILQFSILHDPEMINSFTSAVYDQYEYRLKCILEELDARQIDCRGFDAVAGRGGFIAAGAESGTYLVNDVVVERLKNPTSEHPANLGGILAKAIADIAGVEAYITDPVCVDEMSELAKVTGFKGMVRMAKWQPLSHKATARKLAELIGKKYEDCNLIIGHLGGGISIGAHQCGRVVDVNNGLDGDGPFSVNRPGNLPNCDVINYCFDEGRSKEEVVKTFLTQGGLYSYFATIDVVAVEKMAQSGSREAELILDAMAYGIAREIGSDATVLKGRVDAIGLTGGLANSEYIISRVIERVGFIAPVYLFPGECEMEALALGTLRILTGGSQPIVLDR